MRYNRTLLRRPLAIALIVLVPVIVYGTISRHYADRTVPSSPLTAHACTSVDPIESRVAPVQPYVEFRQAWVTCLG
jgi:hypothetical protein